VNLIAGEHVIHPTEDAERVLPKNKNSGALFIGPYLQRQLGNYGAGPESHVLPTQTEMLDLRMTERWNDFLRNQISVIQFEKRDVPTKCPLSACALQRKELQAHLKSLPIIRWRRKEKWFVNATQKKWIARTFIEQMKNCKKLCYKTPFQSIWYDEYQTSAKVDGEILWTGPWIGQFCQCSEWMDQKMLWWFLGRSCNTFEPDFSMYENTANQLQRPYYIRWM